MKKIVTTIALALLPILGFAQEVKFDKKTNIVTAGENSFRLMRENCGFGGVDCHYDVFDKDNKKVMVINFRDYNSPTEISAGNPKGHVVYSEYVFLETKQKAEVEYFYIKHAKLAKYIIQNKLIVNGLLDNKAVEEFVVSKGTPFKERVKF